MSEQAKANGTDPDSRIMKTRKSYLQGYNAQAVVTEDQIIVAADITQEGNDVHQLHHMLEQSAANLEQAEISEPIRAAAADAGYWSEGNITEAPAKGPELFVATQKDHNQRQAMASAPPPRGRPRKKASPRDRMERKLLTQRGREMYKRRAQTVEPVFGQIKDGSGADRFQRRGVEACRSEWQLLCLTHNLLKIWNRAKAVVKGSGVNRRSKR